jgi:hypothetical protein
MQDLFVAWPWPAGRLDGFVVVVGGVLGRLVLAVTGVTEEQRGIVHRDRGGVRPSARRFGDQLVDDVHELSAPTQRPPLGGARRQPPGLEVDEVKLLFNAQCSRHEASPSATVIDAQFNQC